jgi:hypothetical protein
MQSAQTSLDARAYDLDGGALARDMETRSVTVDPFTMSATCVFSTDAMDRIGDVVDIPGIRTANHQRNPVVFWNHAKQLTLPIGKTVDGAGSYTVILSDNAATQTTFFSQSLLEAEQIFRLIDEGIINANSIAFDNNRVQPIFVAGVRKGLHVLECDLLEISWVGLPINPEAVRKAIDSLVCGRVLAEPIRRSLEPYAARAAAWANGVTLKYYDVRAAILKAAEFEENKHPPATDGRFGDKPGEHEGGDDHDETEETDDNTEDDAAHDRAVDAGEALPDRRPDTILAANVALRDEGDYVISLATGEPVHLDEYDDDLTGNLEKIIPQIKKLDDMHALNAELETVGGDERVFYNGIKPTVIDADIGNEALEAVNNYAAAGNDLAKAAELNASIDASGFAVIPDGKFSVELMPVEHVAGYFEDGDHAARLSNAVADVPEESRADVAGKWNAFLESHGSSVQLVPDLDAGQFAAIDTSMLDEPDRVAEYIADQYDLEDGGEARVEWFNDLMAEYGSGDRLMLTLEDGELAVEIADGPETVKGLRFWSTMSVTSRETELPPF